MARIRGDDAAGVGEMARKDESKLTFDTISIQGIAPQPYDPNIYGYRYSNGTGADRIAGFENTKRELGRLLSQEPRTAGSLAGEIGIDLKSLQCILDYLFTHTGEIAALEITGKETLYIWSGVGIADEIRNRLRVEGVSLSSKDLKPGDISAVSAYITNLIALNPSVETLETAIAKCRKLLDAARVLKSIQGGTDLEQRVALLEIKLGELESRRDAEMKRWTRGDGRAKRGSETDGGGESAAASKILGAADTDSDASDDGNRTGTRRYPFSVAYLTGPSYRYTGPEGEKRFQANDPGLGRMDFSGLRRLVVELDTFTDEIENKSDILSLVEHHVGTIFPDKGLEVVFRRIPGLSYRKKIDRHLHAQILRIRKKGYPVIDNPAG